MEVSQELQDQIIAEQNRLAEIARQQEAKRKAAAAAAPPLTMVADHLVVQSMRLNQTELG